MLRVYRITQRIFTKIANNPKLLQCYDCEKEFDVGSLVVSVTYSNRCKLRCSDCAVRYGIVAKKDITVSKSKLDN